ncbi:MAG: transpeptidase family protein [Prevotella sp.]|nr:transpeptidase family protein [Prevotella sp.]
MSKFDKSKTSPRYSLIWVVIVLIAIAIVAKASYTMTAEKDRWMQVAAKQQSDSVPVPAIRGNILSWDGKLLASTLPEYSLYFDFKAMLESQADTLWEEKADSMCQGICKVIEGLNPDTLRMHLEKGKKECRRYYRICKKTVNYPELKQLEKLPILKLPRYKSGFIAEPHNRRAMPYGKLAHRTIGDLRDSARYGLELYFDSILCGKPGYKNRKKVRNAFLATKTVDAENGRDIVTTLDVSIQDLAETSLRKELEELSANSGVAIVMEVKTGDIRAMVSLEKTKDGSYEEIRDHAVSDLLEPGSVFKTASMLVALDDGVIDTTTMVNTGNGIYEMYGSKMRDHNWQTGGCGYIPMSVAMMKSSNIGVSRLIDEHYKKHPEKFVEGLERLGLRDDLKIPLYDYKKARIRKPGENAYWSKTTLPWMSIGYETMVPPIHTITFYNAIANNGKMVRPRLVKQILKDGQVVKEFKVDVMRPQIAKPEAISKIQGVLKKVVTSGTGKPARSKNFAVAGKTGTAQISKGASGYKSGAIDYLVSFVGYFPADKPLYTCIVCIQKTGTPASGGSMSGKVFHEISEGVMAQAVKTSVLDAKDSTSVMVPDVKDGNIAAADNLLSILGINKKWRNNNTQGDQQWGRIESDRKRNLVVIEPETLSDNGHVPNVRGMGARDAVYLLENRGIKVRLRGRGKVQKQSVGPGEKIKPGMTCELSLG